MLSVGSGQQSADIAALNAPLSASAAAAKRAALLFPLPIQDPTASDPPSQAHSAIANAADRPHFASSSHSASSLPQTPTPPPNARSSIFDFQSPPYSPVNIHVPKISEVRLSLYDRSLLSSLDTKLDMLSAVEQSNCAILAEQRRMTSLLEGIYNELL